ncbi:hypothetical protein DAEQUDRAFT_497040 [Daedalea quercina L-15889]|uniref:Cation/H+ exchanger transmembrane domain-containing protein n=1 Tax=Daedalea quercina L-15889 TaxID=1314783 RepID=A0A165MLB8_9APHY|nr:hypothetical protein DAEQUDRAFT_497040 [Daedalea quercina L-15889]
MGEFSDAVIHLAGSLRWGKRDDSGSQGGLLTGQDPSVFTTSDPLKVWIIQLGVILLITQLLGLFLRRIKQPKVIAEVIGGILLGPTAFGRIPGFTQHIFPSEASSYLSLVANIGLCLFLFLVGMEIDGAIVKRNWKTSSVIALAGMAVPFGLGAALSVPLYHTFISSSVKYTNFMLFTGVAYSITAFPVLCRILTELKLLDTNVGIIVLSAGVGNDVVGWILLALSVALVNAGSGLTALWILLVCVAWALFLFLVVRHVIYWLARRTGSIDNGPTVFFMTVTFLLMFGSAFFTDIIGVQAIFGAFLAGLIIPREGGLCITLTEKLEDMVQIIFLPLYFTLSGLNTNLGLLDDGITWGFTFAIIALSFTGKFGGCVFAAKTLGFSWRESSAIGSFMSCKGLVELIVLNVGLSAGILTQRVFSMFVLEALVLTFMTTPLVNKFYPPGMRVRVGHDAHQMEIKPSPSSTEVDEKISSDLAVLDATTSTPLEKGTEDSEEPKTRLTVVLDKIEHIPGMMALLQLIQPPSTPAEDSKKDKRKSFASGEKKRPHAAQRSSNVSVDALRLIELSDRTSAVMRSSNADTLINTDPLLNIFSTFGDLNGVSVSSSLAIVTYDDLSSSVAEHAQRHRSQLVLVPWLPPQHSTEHGGMAAPSGDGTEIAPASPRLVTTYMSNPFETLFRGSSSGGGGQSPSALHSHFVRSIFSSTQTDVALFIDRHHPGESTLPMLNSQQHIFLPFFGGPDDRLALNFVVQLCAHPRVTATVVRVTRRALDELEHIDSMSKPQVAHLGDERPNEATVHTTTAFPDTVYGAHTTQTRMQSDTADNVIWSRYASRGQDDTPLSAALARIEFSEIRTPAPLRTVVEYAANIAESASERRCRPMLVVGRSRRLAVENHHTELKQLMEQNSGFGSEVKKTVGDVAAALMATGCKASIVVLQATNVPQD